MDEDIVEVSKGTNGILTNGVTNGELDVSNLDKAPSKVVEYDCQSQDITQDSSKVQKFSSKLKEDSGLENGRAYREKDYEESAQKSMQEKHGDTDLGCSSSMQLAEKERVSETAGGGIKSEYAVGSDEQYQTKAHTVSKVGDANIDTSKSATSSYSKACSKIDEQLPSNSVVGGGCEAGSGSTSTPNRRVTDASRADFSHSEQISSQIERPGGGYTKSEGNLEEHSSNQQSQSTVTAPGGSQVLHISTSKKHTSKKESFKMETSSTTPSSSAAQLEEGNNTTDLPAGGAGAAAGTSDSSPPTTPATPSSTSGRPGEIKLSTKISSSDDDGGLLLGNTSAAATSASSSFLKQETISESSKYEHVLSSKKESTAEGQVSSAAVGGTAGGLYSRQQQQQHTAEATPSDTMSVSSMSSAHDLNDTKMSSASSSECAFSSTRMDLGEERSNKDFKYDRKATDSLVKKILGESEGASTRKNKYKIDMGGEDENEAGEDSLLQRRLASLDRAGKRNEDSELYISEDYEFEEEVHSRRTAARAANRLKRTGSDEQDPLQHGSFRGQRSGGGRGYRGSYDFDDEFADQEYGGVGGPRGRQGRYGRGGNYYNDDDYGSPLPPPQPLFRDEEFEPEKRPETEDYVKEKTASIRGMVDRQTTVLENLRKASESFDELTSEIRSIRQAFIENQARRGMMFRDDELPPQEDEMAPRSSYVRGRQLQQQQQQQREEADLSYAAADGRGRRSQYGAAEDYGYNDIGGSRGRQSLYKHDGERDEYGGLSSYGKSRVSDKDYDVDSYASRPLGGAQTSIKKSYYSREEYSATMNAGNDAYNRRLRGLGGRSKSLYDEPTDQDESEGYSYEDRAGGGSSRRGAGRIGLQRTLHDPLGSDDVGKDRYGLTSSYGSGAADGYTRVGDPASSTSSYSSGNSNSAAASRSSYTSSRLTSQSSSSSYASSADAASGSSASSTRPLFSRSRTLSEINFDRSSPASSGGSQGQGNFQSRFLGKVRQRAGAGGATSGDEYGSGGGSKRDKPFKSRFLRSSFDLGDNYSSTSSTSVSASSSKITSDVTKSTSGASERK